MTKLIMLSGLPGSGKSTMAKNLVRETGNSARINRDDLRAMLFESVWTGQREKIVIECEKALAEVLFRNNMNPIVDDTNLGQKHRDLWRNFAAEHKAAFEEWKLEVSPQECIERDAARQNPVGKAVIGRMALSSGLIDWGERKIVVCDIDGTLADGSHREHLIRQSWEAYFALLTQDEPIDFVVRWVRELAKSYTICLVSGRPDTYQRETMEWLNRHNIPYDWIFFRSGTDRRPDVQVKNDILRMLPKDKIEFAIDDRPVVIREVWRANRIRVFPVRGACEEF